MNEPIKIEAEITGTDRAFSMIAGIRLNASHMRPALSVASQVMLTSVRENFTAAGRPERWRGLADSTLKNRIGSKPLTVTGMRGGLKGSLNRAATDTEAIVQTDKVYAAIHNFGGAAGRKEHRVTIPARPFMLLQNEDVPQIKLAILRWLTK